MLNHPLIEPLLVPDELWRGAPPVWIGMGQERAMPGMQLLAATMRRAGVDVDFVQFEGMCHIWMVIMPQIPSAIEAMIRWASAINEMTRARRLSSSDLLIEEGTLREVKLRPPEEYATKEVWEMISRLIREKNNMLPAWTGNRNAIKASI